MNKSDTPRTDDIATPWERQGVTQPLAEHARELERELNAANSQMAQLRAALEGVLTTTSRELFDTDAREAADAALSIPPPPVVPREDAEALAVAIVAMIGGASLDVASQAFADYRAKYPALPACIACGSPGLGGNCQFCGEVTK